MDFISDLFRKDLEWSLRMNLLEVCQNKDKCNNKQLKFIKEDATYEQLLNLSFSMNSQEIIKQELLENIVFSDILVFVKNSLDNETQPLFESILYEAGWGKTRNNSQGDPIHIDALKRGELARAQEKILNQKYGSGKVISQNTPEWKKEIADKGKSFLNKLSNWYDQAKDYLSSPDMKKAGQIGLVVLGATALSVTAYWLYKRYFSTAAKACVGKSGNEFKACVKKFKQDSVKAVIGVLNKNKSKCSVQDDSETCKLKLEKEILKWKNKLNRIR